MLRVIDMLVASFENAGAFEPTGSIQRNGNIHVLNAAIAYYLTSTYTIRDCIILKSNKCN